MHRGDGSVDAVEQAMSDAPANAIKVTIVLLMRDDENGKAEDKARLLIGMAGPLLADRKVELDLRPVHLVQP